MIENLAQYKKSCSSTWWGILKEICSSSESLSKMTSQIKYKNWYNIGSAITHKNLWDSLYCHEKVLKNVRHCSKIPTIPPPSWFNVLPSLEKLCQAVVARNEQAILQPTLNKGARGPSLTIVVTDCWFDFKLWFF